MCSAHVACSGAMMGSAITLQLWVAYSPLSPVGVYETDFNSTTSTRKQLFPDVLVAILCVWRMRSSTSPPPALQRARPGDHARAIYSDHERYSVCVCHTYG